RPAPPAARRPAHPAEGLAIFHLRFGSFPQGERKRREGKQPAESPQYGRSWRISFVLLRLVSILVFVLLLTSKDTKKLLQWPLFLTGTLRIRLRRLLRARLSVCASLSEIGRASCRGRVGMGVDVAA